MSCIINPPIQDPYIDVQVIKELQTVMATTGWLEEIFGLARKNQRKTNEDDDVIFPGVYKQECNDYIDLFPDDKMTSFCFFERRSSPVLDPVQDIVQYDLGIVCWANLKKVKPSLTHDYTDAIVAKTLSVLNLLTNSNSWMLTNAQIVGDIEPELDRTVVWDQYDYSFEDFKYHSYPYTTFRIDLTIDDYKPIDCQAANIDFDVSPGSC